jgi:putative SOS response-associated peptidase YedK
MEQVQSTIGVDEAKFEKFNMSPGMDAYVFWKDEKTGTIKLERKVWGLIAKPGSAASPLPKGMGKHFNNLMFNARSDTLYERPSYARLAHSGKTCLIAVDGFFEWRKEGGKKQPYFVYRNKGQSNTRPYLLFAGLWTSVATGYTEIDDPSTLDSFTILTTDACKPLEWLHTRMPVVIWDGR